MTMIASHNSWSYLTPANFLMWPFRFMAQCQDMSMQKQFDMGVRCFDLRVRFDRDGSPYLCHGLMRFMGSPHEVLYCLNALSRLTLDKVYCRVLLEDNLFTKDRRRQELLFGEFCCRLESNIGMKQIMFFGGYTKYWWRDHQVYEFKTQEPRILERHSSVVGSKIHALCPYLFAKNNNLRFRLEGANADFLMIDFVEL